MGVYKDPRTGRYLFKVTAKFPNNITKRITGRPGLRGSPYEEFAPTRSGAYAAEERCLELAAAGKLETWEADRAAAARASERPKTIREHAADFVELYKPGSKGSEKRSKQQILDSDLLPFFGELTIPQLTQQHLDRFAATQLKEGGRDGDGCSVKTINNRLAVLSTLIKYVTGARPVGLRFKLDGMPAEIEHVPQAHVERLLAAAEAAGQARNRVAILLAYEAGLRAGEIRGLQWTDRRGGQITIRRALDNVTDEVTAPKHNKARTIPESPRLAAALDALPKRGLWVIAREDGEALSYAGLVEAVRTLYTLADVPRPDKVLHCIRHTFGTVMARRVPLGVLQKLMGHSEIKTTMRYVDVSEDDKREAIAMVFGVPAHPEAERK